MDEHNFTAIPLAVKQGEQVIVTVGVGVGGTRRRTQMGLLMPPDRRPAGLRKRLFMETTELESPGDGFTEHIRHHTEPRSNEKIN